MSTYSDVAKRTLNLHPDVSCSGKDKFTTQVMATKVANAGNRRKGSDISAYRCGHCGGWHVGSASIKARQRKNHAFKTKRAAPIEEAA